VEEHGLKLLLGQNMSVVRHQGHNMPEQRTNQEMDMELVDPANEGN
jgi:hypothetical protein